MRHAVSLVLMFALGCSEPAPTRYELGVDTALYVGEGGAWDLHFREGSILSAAANGALLGHRYEAQIRSVVGFWNFRRTHEEVENLQPTGLHHQNEEGDVEIDYGAGGTLSIQSDDGSVAFEFTPASDSNYSALSVQIRCDDASNYLGFGAQYSRTNQRGHAFDLWVQEQGIGRTGTNQPILGGEYHSYFPMPFWLDTRGFGVLFETSARVHADLCSSDPQIARLEVQDGAPVRWRVLAGTEPAEVIGDLGERLGRPTPLPAWAYDLWLGAQGGRDAVLEVADQLEREEIPVGALWVQDWTGRQDFGLGNFGVRYRWVADAEFYPELSEMISTLRARGLRFLGYANPFVVESLDDHFPRMRDDGLLVRDADGAPYTMGTPNGIAALPDLTNPATRAYIKGFLREMVRTYGMDGWMVDFGEWLPHDAVLFDGSSAALAHNLYPTEWHRLSREVMEEERPDADFALFSRSGWTGEQGVAQLVWIGDQEADFSPSDGLPTVVPALLNMGISAIPFVTHDVGGFSGGPRTREVFLRWTELGAFTPVMRTHEGLRREQNHAWNTDAETVDHFRRFTRIHAALRPEFEALEREALRSSLPPIRHLALHFPTDPATHEISDEFLLGEDILVAPIVEEGATEREVYLPEGRWFHIWTGVEHEGPSHIVVQAPIGAPPVFSRNTDRPDLRAIE